MVYILQNVANYAITIGYSKPAALPAALARREAKWGPQRRVAMVAGLGSADKAAILGDMAEWRVADPTGRRARAFELLAPLPLAVRYLNSAKVEARGVVRLERARDPDKQTVREWLENVAWCESAVDGGRAARVALEADDALRETVRRLAPNGDPRGGWDLNESIGRPGALMRQLPLGFAEDYIDGTDWWVRSVRYRGAEFRFPVFAECYRRQTRKTPPPTAVRTTTPIYFALGVASGRKGERRAPRQPVPAYVDPRQGTLPGA